MQFKFGKYAYHNGYVDFFPNLTKRVWNKQMGCMHYIRGRLVVLESLMSRLSNALMHELCSWHTVAKLCASFQSHEWILTRVTVRKCSIRVKIGNFLSRVTLKFDGWPWKTIGHLFYATSSFVHHFIAISEFKLKLESGNAQFGSKSTIFLSRVTLKFDRWPWKTIGHIFYATSSFVHHFVAIGEFKLGSQSGNA